MKARLKHAARLVTPSTSRGVLPLISLEQIESGTGKLLGEPEPRAIDDPAGVVDAEPGDVLLGKLRPYLAKSFLVQAPVRASSELLCLRPLNGVDSAWLFYLAGSKLVTDWAVATSHGTKMPRTSWDKVREVPVRIPPLLEQRRVAAYLDREAARIDALIAAKDFALRLLDARRVAVLISALAPAQAPTVWSSTRLKFMFGQPQSGTWGAEPHGDDSDTLCVRVAGFDRRKLQVNSGAETMRRVEADEFRKRSLRAGDTLLEKSGGGEGQPVGFAVLFARQDRKAVCSNFIARLRARKGVDPSYAALALAAAYWNGRNGPYVKQTTGIQNLDVA